MVAVVEVEAQPITLGIAIEVFEVAEAAGHAEVQRAPLPSSSAVALR